ncbi:MAG TPA: alpha-amylase family glycosyl hydrolase [Solirubrobacteraceae bacterium]|nr:alpha-amylase family glycosyl hydrolase [Solirubrobacteraceae bacterium]
MWWREAVVYQIYPRSFADVSGDGVGDLEGLRSRLEHLQWLGVDALWLSPIYRSPMADFGYDVADYCDVDPLFGDLASFDALLEEAHLRGLRVLLDWVPNHTSDQHPWFVESRSSRDSPKRSWYRWRDGTPDTPPNNWPAAFGGGPAWTWDEGTEQWYLHTFLPEQPDLNWDEPDVVAAMHDVLRFWMDRGVDGFRADVVHLIGKDPALPDLAAIDPAARHLMVVGKHDFHGTHELLRGIRGVLDEYPERMMVGEVNLSETALIAPYLGEDDELHLAFDFESLFVPWEAGAWRERIAHVEEIMRERWPTWVFSNHDQPRIRTRLGGGEARARAALVMVLTLRGTPFLYAGEELGLEDAVVPPDRVVDPGGRDGCRAPIPWTADDRHGWPAEPWLPWSPDPGARSVEAQRADPGSFLHLAHAVLAARRASTALRTGGLRLLDGAPDGVLAYERAADDEHRRVWINFGPSAVELPTGWEAELRTDEAATGGEAVPLSPDAAAILRPR